MNVGQEDIVWMAGETAPSFNARIYTAATLSAIVEELASQQIAPDFALGGTQLKVSEIDQHDCRISYRQLDRVITNAVTLSHDPCTAFNAGSRMRVTSYGMYGYAMLSSQFLTEVIELTHRYIRIGTPCCSAKLKHHGNRVICDLTPMYWPIVSSAQHRFSVEFAMAAHLKVIQDLLGPDFGFSNISLRYGRPAYFGEYERIFNCPTWFEQDENGYEFEGRFLNQPLPYANPRTNAMVQEICRKTILDIDSIADLGSAVRRLLIEGLGRTPLLDDIAASLNMHPRALRRGLAIEGTSFRDICSSVKKELALGYLRDTKLTNEDIAYRLGFSDAANFRQFFKRVTGLPPSDFREKS